MSTTARTGFSALVAVALASNAGVGEARDARGAR
jgi:hypothetical protein